MYSEVGRCVAIVRPIMEKSPSHSSRLYPLHNANVWPASEWLVKATTSTSCAHFLKDLLVYHILNFSLATTFHPRHRYISTD
jgi:hypothetical protein